MQSSAYFQSASGAPLSRTVPYLPCLPSQPDTGKQAERRLRGQDHAGVRNSSPSESNQDWDGIKAKNPRGLGTCVREDLMDLLIERNQPG